jgi:hypothetical protein
LVSQASQIPGIAAHGVMSSSRTLSASPGQDNGVERQQQGLVSLADIVNTQQVGTSISNKGARWSFRNIETAIRHPQQHGITADDPEAEQESPTRSLHPQSSNAAQASDLSAIPGNTVEPGNSHALTISGQQQLSSPQDETSAAAANPSVPANAETSVQAHIHTDNIHNASTNLSPDISHNSIHVDQGNDDFASQVRKLMKAEVERRQQHVSEQLAKEWAEKEARLQKARDDLLAKHQAAQDGWEQRHHFMTNQWNQQRETLRAEMAELRKRHNAVREITKESDDRIARLTTEFMQEIASLRRRQQAMEKWLAEQVAEEIKGVANDARAKIAEEERRFQEYLNQI